MLLSSVFAKFKIVNAKPPINYFFGGHVDYAINKGKGIAVFYKST